MTKVEKTINLISEKRGGLAVHIRTLQRPTHGLEICPEGYGQYDYIPGFGAPIYLDYYEGKLELLVWADINEEEPTHRIDLSGALESARVEPVATDLQFVGEGI